MSPTVFKAKGYTFFFFSREEKRMHVHIRCGDGEAKFWLEPIVALAVNHGLREKQLREISSLVEENYEEIKKAWKKHFKS
jgi:hypothetical protein